jgi:tagaturonate reductase
MPPSQKTAATAQKINHVLERLIPITTPLAIIIGFLLPSFFVHLRPFVQTLFGIMTFSGALKLRPAQLGTTIRRPSPILLFFFAAHIVMPVFAMAISSLFLHNQDVTAGFVLLFSGPTAVSGFIWVSIFKGDMALGLTLILLDTLFAPLVVPGSVSLLMGSKIAMAGSSIAASLLFMVVVPTFLGVTVNEISKGKIPALVCPWFDPFAKICLMAVIATNASIIAPGVRFNDPLVWKTAVIVIAVTFAGFFIIKFTAVIGRCRSPKDISMIIAGGLRNNSAVMTIAVSFFPEAASLPTLLSIMFQQTIMAIMGKVFSVERKQSVTS